MITPSNNAQNNPVTAIAAITAFLLVFLHRFVLSFGTVFGALAAFRIAGFLPGLFS